MTLTWRDLSPFMSVVSEASAGAVELITWRRDLWVDTSGTLLSQTLDESKAMVERRITAGEPQYRLKNEQGAAK